jgi:hypothetical protein
MRMGYERMLDKETKPSEEDMLDTIATPETWLDLTRYVEESYDCSPEPKFFGKKYGWMLRYRKGGRTLCSLFPERGAFSVLLVLGGKEAEAALGVRDDLCPPVRQVLEETEQLHDGRWLWIRVLGADEAADVKRLLAFKRRPKRPAA